jgi:2,3-dihydroxyphenylpropionate 1,2-dioxygenase
MGAVDLHRVHEAEEMIMTAMPLKTICLSHSPFIGLVSPGEQVERAVRAQLTRLADEVTAYAPDLIVLFAPDHFNGFFYDMLPAFCVGVRAESIGDYRSPPGPLRTDEDIAIRFAEVMSEEGFDLNVSYRMQVDHAFAQPLSALTGSLQRYPVLPVFINAAAPPRPSLRRVRKFGEAAGRFALATGKKVLLVGSRGLSHDPPVPEMKSAPPDVQEALIARRNPPPKARRLRQERIFQLGKDFASGKGNLRALNDEWDRNFIALLESGSIEQVDRYADGWITAEAGRAGHEVRSWVAAFAAQSAAGAYRTELLYQGAIPEWIVGMAIMIAEQA